MLAAESEAESESSSAGGNIFPMKSALDMARTPAPQIKTLTRDQG